MDNAKEPEEFDELQKSINDDSSYLKTYLDDNRLKWINVNLCYLEPTKLFEKFPALQFTSITNPSDK